MRNKKIKENIDYGDRRERMSPSLTSKLGDPESRYAQNLAMKKGEKDVERLVSSRFQKVAKKLSDVTNIQNLTPSDIQRISFEYMRKIPSIMRIESAHKKELEELAVEACLIKTKTPNDWYQIEATLGMPNIEGFRMGDKKEEDDNSLSFSDFNPESLPDFDVKSTDNEIILKFPKEPNEDYEVEIIITSLDGDFLDIQSGGNVQIEVNLECTEEFRSRKKTPEVLKKIEGLLNQTRVSDKRTSWNIYGISNTINVNKIINLIPILSEDEDFKLEKDKRTIINAIIQGRSKKGHYVFEEEYVKNRLDAINPSLFEDYLVIMAVNDMLYFTMDDMIVNMSQTGAGIAGKAQLGSSDKEYQKKGISKKIIATGLIFPILCHEILKGLEEAKGKYGFPSDRRTRKRVQQDVDRLENEPEDLRIGPEIVDMIDDAIPDEVRINQELQFFFEVSMYQIPAREFLQIIGNVISDNSSNVSKGKDSFKKILIKAKKLKEEFEEALIDQNIDKNKIGKEELKKIKYEFLDKLGLDYPSEN